MTNYHPPFTLTPELLGLVADIAEHIGRLTERQTLSKNLALRRINRIRTTQGSEKSSEKSSGKSSGKSSVEILVLIQNNPSISAPELAEHLGISVRAIEKQLAKLKAAGKLSRIGAAKGGHWQVNGAPHA